MQTAFAPTSAAPATSAAAVSAQAATGYGVDLGQAIENAHATVELAARQGLTQARIQLEPAELGAIHIHLTQTAAGLLARVSAESAAASQALAAAHGELRRSLAGIGIDLARLHVGTHGSAGAEDGGRGAGEQTTGGAGADPRGPGAQGSGGGLGANGEAQTGEDEALAGTEAKGSAAAEPHTSDAGTAEHEAYAPGALVDVLA